jgi:uncharacterized iron-regulated membrane protein
MTSVRVHCQDTTGFQYYLEYTSLEVAQAMVKRLVEQGYSGVPVSPALPQAGHSSPESTARLDRVEQALKELVAHLTALEERLDVQAQTPAPAQTTVRRPRRQPVGHRQTIPPTWERLQRYLEEHGLQRVHQVAEALALPTAGDLLRRMAAAGLIDKVASGVYESWSRRRRDPGPLALPGSTNGMLVRGEGCHPG